MTFKRSLKADKAGKAGYSRYKAGKKPDITRKEAGLYPTYIRLISDLYRSNIRLLLLSYYTVEYITKFLYNSQRGVK